MQWEWEWQDCALVNGAGRDAFVARFLEHVGGKRTAKKGLPEVFGEVFNLRVSRLCGVEL